MELKINYQYTYFIHPFIIKENEYEKYILSLLNNKKINLKVFNKDKDEDLYKYFLYKTRKLLFSSVSKTKDMRDEFEREPKYVKASILSKLPCVMFEYDLEKEIQVKTKTEKGILFRIQKIELICFNTGICFLCMKTYIENTKDFGDVLNFNYKFREINQENKLKGFDKIYLQTDSFKNTKELREFIKELTGSDIEKMKLDINTQNFLTYSYVCIDGNSWNANQKFDDIENNFIKFAKVMPSDNSSDLNIEEIEVFSKWKYAKIGITKQAVTLFASSTNINNFTKLPDKFEKEYFYTYILNLYKRIFLKKIEAEFGTLSKSKKANKKFLEFNKDTWMTEITEDESGSKLNNKISKVLDLDRLFLRIKSKYEIIYNEINIQSKSTRLVITLLVIGVLIIVYAFRHKFL